MALMLLALKHRLEYLAILLVAGLFRLAPHWLALTIAWLLARLAFHLFRFRRSATLHRMVSVFGDQLTPRQRRRNAYLSLRNLFFNIAEMMRAGRLNRRWFMRHVQNYEPTMERLRQLIAEHGGAVLALPHLGNWDLAGIAVERDGLKLFSVAGVQRNRLVNDWINRQRGIGIDILPRGSSTLRQIVRRLRQGQIFAILPDVRTRRPDLTIPFLGGQANLGRGMAQFARLAKVPVVPVTVERVGWFHHRFTILEPIHPDPAADSHADAVRVTTAVMEQIEAMIRANPGQWFWYNKRWVLDPL